MATPTLLDQVRIVARLRHLSHATEQTYAQYIKRYILFHGKRHPATLGAPEIEAYLAHLAIDAHVSASTQNVAFAALIFLIMVYLAHDRREHFWLKTGDSLRPTKSD